MPLNLDVLLINIEDFSNFRDISVNTDADRLNALIREAQIREIRSFLGDALYFAMIQDYTPVANDEGTFTEQRFTDLWYGVAWVKNSFTIQLQGLKPAHVYYSYERFLYQNKLNVTRYGDRVLADNDFSENLVTTKKYEVSADSMGLVYQFDAKDYIEENPDLFPEYNNPEIKREINTGWKFMKIGKLIGR